MYNVGHLNFTNATITQNSAVSGGGIYNSLGSLTAINATIADNFASAAGHGGGLDVAGGSVAIYNTIVASNIRGSTTADDIFPLATGTVSSTSSYNLIGTGATVSSPTTRTAIRSASKIRTWARSPKTAARSRPSPC